jgi:hypothetical protein
MWWDVGKLVANLRHNNKPKRGRKLSKNVT